jgi:hypothetical protein
VDTLEPLPNFRLPFLFEKAHEQVGRPLESLCLDPEQPIGAAEGGDQRRQHRDRRAAGSKRDVREERERLEQASAS